MVLMNLFAVGKGDAGIENRLVDIGGRERVGRMERVAENHTQYYANDIGGNRLYDL